VPSVSEAQRRYLISRFGHYWIKRHHFDNKGKLPDHVIQRAIKSRKKKRVRAK